MGDSFRGFGEMFVNVVKGLAALIVILAVGGFFFTRWVDNEFGRGTASPLLLIGAGIGFAILLFAIVTLLNNMTHRSAGDDIVAIFDGISNVLTKREASQTKLLQEKAKQQTLEVKDQMDERKAQRSFSSWFAKRDVKVADAESDRERRQREAVEAAEAEWEWIEGYDDGAADGSVEVMD